MKKVLILGAGLVAGPIIKFLLNKGFQVTVASSNSDRAQQLIGDEPNGIAYHWEAKDESTLDKFIQNHDITVSLLPYTFHVMVAEKCIKHKKNMVTTSYVSAEMQALDEKAKDAGIILLNECGLDPGLDHMSAKRIIDTVHGLGGKIIEYQSVCGALPAPEISKDNPFRYKFSWSPKGVLLAGNNDAIYLKKSKEVHVPAEKLFTHTFKLPVFGVEELEIYPNRNSMPYIKLYDIPETTTMFRGTLRYKGWCEIMDVLKKLNLTTEKQIDFTGMTYAEMMAKLMKLPDTNNLKQKTAKFLKIDQNSTAIKALEFLGLFDQKPMNRKKVSSHEVIADLMVAKMMLGENERDLCILQHLFLAKYPDGKQELISSRLLDYGEPDGDTAIARTVALPAACAVKMILEDEIPNKGVHIPVLPDIYIPILHELELMGIELVEQYGLPLVNNIKW